MARLAGRDVQSLIEISKYHGDVVDSLKLFFATVSERVEIRYLLKSSLELAEIREERLAETDLRSALVILSSIEAVFRVDCIARCEGRKKDALSRDFRTLSKSKRKTHLIDFDAEILELWVTHHPELKNAIGELRGAMNYRHWLAHGRYFTPKLGRRYDYEWLYLLAKGIFDTFPFAG